MAPTTHAHGTTGAAPRHARHDHSASHTASHRRAPSANRRGRGAAHHRARIAPTHHRARIAPTHHRVNTIPARVHVDADPITPVSLSRTVPSTLPIQTGDATLDAAEATALTTLTVDQAGAPTHRAAPFYSTPWIRDSFAWGMIPDNQGTLATYATTELAYWLGRQQPFGGFISFQYSGWYDETPIIIAAVLDAYRQTGNLTMVRRALPQLEHAWTWMDHSYAVALRRHGSSCLIWVDLRPRGAHFAADWADQVARQGYSPQLQGLWLRATRALAALELLTGQPRRAHGYIAAASCITRDINRLLWRVDAPAHLNATPLAAFGHYRAWPVVPGRAYFEVDGNALLVATDAADAARRDSVLGTIMANKHYLLGNDGAGPARVLYGDYAPADYAPIHNWIGPGRYQSAYWPTVGGLLAIAAARYDHTTTSLAVLEGLARRDADPTMGFHEWYGGDGTPGGAATYGWGARMYLLALYRAALGVDDSTGLAHPADLTLRASPLEARGELTRLGRHITVIGHGKGQVRYLRLDGRTLHTTIVPAALLHDGSVLDVYRG